ncbi:MAG: formylglycine-generating enzyme family protein [Kocuria sp.]|nr:formylglycine-generating enzyme family protein [Kocuria sp.]
MSGQKDSCYGCSTLARGAFAAPAGPSIDERDDARGSHPIAQVPAPEGTFVIGDPSGAANQGDGETPLHSIMLQAFEMDATSVTNAAFQRFVDAVGYETDAER